MSSVALSNVHQKFEYLCFMQEECRMAQLASSSTARSSSASCRRGQGAGLAPKHACFFAHKRADRACPPVSAHCHCELLQQPGDQSGR